jgi:P27 family predicted phage terminase small subunit
MPDFYAVLGDRKAAADARLEWQRTVPRLDDQGLLASLDAFLVEDLCVCAARIKQCERAISADGLMTDAAGRTDRGQVRHPLMVCLGQYRAHYAKLCRLLGIGPAARQSLEVRNPTPPGGLNVLQQIQLSTFSSRHLGLAIDFADPDWDLAVTDEQYGKIKEEMSKWHM